MDRITDDDEIVKLLDVKDMEIIQPDELIENNENDQNTENKKRIIEQQENGNESPTSNGIIEPCTERRSDEPTELSFEKGDEIFHFNHEMFKWWFAVCETFPRRNESNSFFNSSITS